MNMTIQSIANRPIPKFEGSFTRNKPGNGVEAYKFDDIVLLDNGFRTPFGKQGGELATTSPFKMLELVSKEMISRLKDMGFKQTDIQQTKTGGISPVADYNQPFNFRSGITASGLNPNEFTSREDNILCGTGFDVIAQSAFPLCNGGEEQVILAGAMENMSQSPQKDAKINIMAMKAAKAVKALAPANLKKMSLGEAAATVKASLAAIKDFQVYKLNKNPEMSLIKGLTDPAGDWMLVTADMLSNRFNIPQEDIDKYSLLSQQRYGAALEAGRFEKEILPINKEDLPSLRIKDGAIFDTDSHARPNATMEGIQKPRPMGNLFTAFKNKGKYPETNFFKHRASNSSGVVDGAAIVPVSTQEFADMKGAPVLSKVVTMATAGVHQDIMGYGPAKAMPAALKQARLTMDDMDFVEINEAFAGQVLACANALVLEENVLDDAEMKILLGAEPPTAEGTERDELNAVRAKIAPVLRSPEHKAKLNKLMEKLNVDGGSIAIGHPLPVSGLRITLHAAEMMKAQNLQYGLVSACIGGGQGIALVIENPSYDPTQPKNPTQAIPANL